MADALMTLLNGLLKAIRQVIEILHALLDFIVALIRNLGWEGSGILVLSVAAIYLILTRTPVRDWVT